MGKAVRQQCAHGPVRERGKEEVSDEDLRMQCSSRKFQPS